MWLSLATEVGDDGRSADDLAMLRDAWEFRNLLLVEQPNGDFGQTMVRQFLFDQFHILLLEELKNSTDERVGAIASKAVKEVAYHAERSARMVIRLGDGTRESHQKVQTAFDLLWPYTAEMFECDHVDAAMVGAGVAPEPERLATDYTCKVRAVTEEATLALPEDGFAHTGGRSGSRHSEHLGHMLAQMQWLQRAYPDATW